ncbi:MAG: hypothetical protein IPJ47_12860 [Anaerolineales bacterium]|nr:hypothetical protein [Anaerolineales bacterium]
MLLASSSLMGIVLSFSEKDAELAVTYANQVAIALENARLFSEVQKSLLPKGINPELEGKTPNWRFTYTVSHDLKSPIITIRGFLGFLGTGCTLPVTRQGCVGM